MQSAGREISGELVARAGVLMQSAGREISG